MTDQNNWLSLQALIAALKGTQQTPAPDYSLQAKRALGLENVPNMAGQYNPALPKIPGAFHYGAETTPLEYWVKQQEPIKRPIIENSIRGNQPTELQPQISRPPPMPPITGSTKITDRVPIDKFEDRFNVKQEPVIFTNAPGAPQRPQPPTFEERFAGVPAGKWYTSDNIPQDTPGARKGWASAETPLPRSRPTSAPGARTKRR